MIQRTSFRFTPHIFQRLRFFIVFFIVLLQPVFAVSNELPQEFTHGFKGWERILHFGCTVRDEMGREWRDTITLFEQKSEAAGVAIHRGAEVHTISDVPYLVVSSVSKETKTGFALTEFSFFVRTDTGWDRHDIPRGARRPPRVEIFAFVDASYHFKKYRLDPDSVRRCGR